jgi:microcin C transport system substrate-binding protein
MRVCFRVWWLMVCCGSPRGPRMAMRSGATSSTPGLHPFDYVNPAAPKGGELRLVSNLRVSTFDKYNPFTIKGAAPAYLDSLLFDTLLTGSMDETAPATACWPKTWRSPRPPAASPSACARRRASTTAMPVAGGRREAQLRHPDRPLHLAGLQDLLQTSRRCDVLDERTMRFRFKKPNRELPLTWAACRSSAASGAWRTARPSPSTRS